MFCIGDFLLQIFALEGFVKAFPVGLTDSYKYIYIIFSTSLSLAGNSGGLTWVMHSSRKSSATHFCQRVQYFRLSRQWCGCQGLGFLTCAQLLMHATAHGGCTDTVRESALEVDSTKRERERLETTSVLRLAFQSDALPV